MQTEVCVPHSLRLLKIKHFSLFLSLLLTSLVFDLWTVVLSSDLFHIKYCCRLVRDWVDLPWEAIKVSVTVALLA